MRFHFRAALLALVFATEPAHAQESEGRSIEFRVVCLEHRDKISLAKIATGKSDGTLEIPLLTGAFTDQFKASFKSDSASFFVDDPDAPDKRRVIATGKLAAGAQQVFLLIPSSSPSMPYRILSMNDDEQSFPMGSVRVLNLCASPIRLMFSATTLKPIQPGKIVTYPPVTAVDEWGMYQVRLDFATKAGKWVPVASPSWKGTKFKRDLVITRVDARTKQPLISYYKDIPPWRKPQLVPTEGS